MQLLTKGFLIGWEQMLQMELQSRRERLEEVLERAGAVAALRTPESDLVREGAEHARQLWEVLLVEAERRTVMLDAVFHAQQYYTQAAKAESWLSGQKLHVINEERGTVRSFQPFVKDNTQRSYPALTYILYCTRSTSHPEFAVQVFRCIMLSVLWCV